MQWALQRTKADLSWRRGFPQILPPQPLQLAKKLRECREMGLEGEVPWGDTLFLGIYHQVSKSMSLQ